jgi:hypothetical protein
MGVVPGWTFAPERILPSTLQGPFTFTYPSVYLAHRPITRVDEPAGYTLVSPWLVRSDQKPRVGRIIRNASTIAVHSNDVYSEVVRMLNTETGVEYARLVAAGKFSPLTVPLQPVLPLDYETRTRLPFDYGHLQNPVPASIYYQARSDCWGEQMHCGTITDDSYRPTIVVKNKVWFSAFPDHFSCRGLPLNDPPKAISILPAPTLEAPSISPFHYATPGSGVGPALSEPTAFEAVEAISPTNALKQRPHFGKSNILIDALIGADALPHFEDTPSRPSRTRPMGLQDDPGNARPDQLTGNEKDPVGRTTKSSPSRKSQMALQNAGDTFRASSWHGWCIIAFSALLYIL